MQRKIIIILFILLLQPVCYGQYLSKIESLLSGSLQENALNESYKTDSLGYRRGLNPADPRIEIAYFTNNGFEASITNELDLPSLYRQRNRISKYNISKTDAEMRLKRLDLLSDLSDKYLDLIYNIKLLEFIKDLMPKDSITYFGSMIKDALNNGDITMLDYTDLKIVLNTVNDVYQQCEDDIKIRTNDIRMYCPSFQPQEEDFPEFNFKGLTSEEFIKMAYDNNPLKDIILNDSLIAERELKLARWEWAPKIVVGFRLDRDDNKLAPGGVGGISIPMWENRGNIKHSKAKIKSCDLINKTKETELKTELQDLYDKYNSASERYRTWENFDIEEHASTLYKAYRLGLITAAEYYLKFSNVINNAFYLYGLQHEKAATAARMEILLN